MNLTSSTLVEVAESNDVTVDYFPLGESGSCSVSVNGHCHIGLDRHRATEAVSRVRIAHELGHCVRDAFYNERSPVASRGKCERLADEYAIQLLVPEYEFWQAIRSGSTEVWQIAEEFLITCNFAEKVMRFYLQSAS